MILASTNRLICQNSPFPRFRGHFSGLPDMTKGTSRAIATMFASLYVQANSKTAVEGIIQLPPKLVVVIVMVNLVVVVMVV